jgi:hypothetical protein
MGWHIHFKNGKYAIWSTIVDDYVTTWGSEQEIKQYYIRKRLQDFAKQVIQDSEEVTKQARENNGCSVPYINIRCNSI